MSNKSESANRSGGHAAAEETSEREQQRPQHEGAASSSSYQEHPAETANPSSASNEVNFDTLVLGDRQRRGASGERRGPGDGAQSSSGQQQQQLADGVDQASPSNEVNFDALVIRERQQMGASSSGDLARSPSRTARPKPPGMDGMADFGSGVLGANLPILQLNLDRLIAGKQDRIVHAHVDKEQQQQQEEQAEHPSSAAISETAVPSTSSPSAAPTLPEEQQQQEQQHQKRKQQQRESRRSKHQQQQKQQQQQQRDTPPSQPRPHPFYLRPQHVKTNYKCPTSDGWMLHIIRTKQLGQISTRVHPVILCPGLGSSGAYSFDLSPDISLADYLASKGWDVWTVELRGRV